jgi:serine/threonine protein kinase/tetratricopeptide (TPR) repeat protein
MPTDPRRVKELFADALDLADEPARQAFLDRECAGDEELRRRLEALLRAHDQTQSALDQPLVAVAPLQAATTLADEQAGTILVGKYKLLERIGEGGMGSVWMAQQTEPVKRTVAVKLIKSGGDSRAVLARFEAERQALALMDHPNIARVLDAGTTERGQPFFVMELVKGVPITKFCDARKLTPRQRLELFIPVCQAIQHAHQKGIIHRDIKPSNVLVALYDDRPVPKVIDFGVAKAAGARLTDETLHTGFGAIIGTPQYMSPEQATLNNLDIDTRSDIYSLGVLLYELLTGSPPFVRKELEKAGMLEILRVIREVEPLKPSTKISTADALPSLAANRGMEPTQLARLLRGDIDWIVMKALDKERARRYETANGLAMDIQRYLADEPVLAGPPTVVYRLRKFVKRHKGRVVAASLVLLALLAGMVGTTVGLIRARWAEAAAQADAQRARDAEKKAADEEAVAREVSDFMRNDLLAQAGPHARADRHAMPDANIKMRTVLDRAAESIPGKFSRPLVEAAVRLTIGDAYVELGEYKAALPHLERALELYRRERGPDHPETLHAALSVGRLYQLKADFRRAVPLLTDTLAACRTVLGNEDYATLTAMNLLATIHEARGRYRLAEPLYREALETRRRVKGEDHPDTIVSLGNLGLLYQRQGKEKEAEKLTRQALDMSCRVQGPEHPDTLTAMMNLAVMYSLQARHEKAQELANDAVDLHKRVYGEEHVATLTAINNLACVYEAAGQFDEAEPLYVRVLKTRRRVLGEVHPDTIVSVSNLGVLYMKQGKIDEAEQLLENAAETASRVLDEEHPDVLLLKGNLVQLYRDRNKRAEAEKLAESVLKSLEEVLGDEHRTTLTLMNTLASLREARGDLDGAEPLYVRCLDQRRRVLGADAPDTLSSLNNLALLYVRRNKLDKAEPLLVETLEAMRRIQGAKHPHTILVMNNLGAVYERLGKFDKAEPLYEESVKAMRQSASLTDPTLAGAVLAQVRVYDAQDKYDNAEPILVELLAAMREKHGDDHPLTAVVLAQLGLHHLKRRRYAAAEPVLRDCLRIREQKQPDEWATFNTMSMLGEALAGQKKHIDAQPLLRNGYEEMRKRQDKIPNEVRKVRLTDAVQRLVQFYEATNNPDEAAKWRKELDALNDTPKQP